MRTLNEAKIKKIEIEKAGHQVFAIMTNGERYELVIDWYGENYEKAYAEMKYAESEGWTKVEETAEETAEEVNMIAQINEEITFAVKTYIDGNKGIARMNVVKIREMIETLEITTGKEYIISLSGLVEK